ncbi:MAG: anti-sigma factor antagonist [Coriobacteriales bacterium]|nr:anti-sigma factor antagonist [Coriobacteriales bacterium]
MFGGENSRVISLVGDITWQTAPRLKERLTLLINQGNTSLVLNMASVDYVDSSGLALLISIKRLISKHDGSMLLINASDSLIRLLHQARLIELIPTVGKSALCNKIASVPAHESPSIIRSSTVSYGPSGMAKTRDEVAELFVSLGLPRNTTYDLVLALGEALGNAFDHGGGDTVPESVTVTVSVYSDRIVMEVSDCGCGCSYHMGDELPEPTETRGRGIRLMLMLTDSVEIEPKQSGQGTCVRLVKMLDCRQIV